MDAESLIRTLRAYDAPVDATAVKAAFDNEHNQVLRDWVSLHVGPDTLLSIDELDQFNALEASGGAQKLAASSDLASVQSFSENETRDAIEQLNRSTEAISKQTESLKQQHEALGRLVSGNKKDQEARAALEAKQVLRWNANRRATVIAVEELSQRLDSKIAELEQQSGGGGRANIQQTAEVLFHSDDKLLSSLQKLGYELDTEDPDEQDNVVMLRETCARLIKFTVEGLRTKLDRTYLEALASSMRSGATKGVSADDVSALQEEVESLYAEILPVAQMSVEQQFLEPALKNLAARNSQGLAKSEEAVRYMHDCLDYILERTEELAQRVESFQAYQVAATALVDVARSELSAKVELPTKKEPSVVPASPARRPKSGVPVGADSPARSRAQSGRRRSSGIGLADEPPLDEILRGLAISLSIDESGVADPKAQAEELASILAERRAKVDDVARNAQESFEHMATRQIEDAKLAIQLLRDSILAESPFGQVRLVDPEIDGSIGLLSQEMDDIRVKLDGVDAGLVKLRGKSAKKDELLARWGSR
ncbi:hypothetical protein OQA88_844 [Cercophora sp. LCS_1]